MVSQLSPTLNKLQSSLEPFFNTTVEQRMAIDIALLKMEVPDELLVSYLDLIIELSQHLSQQGAQLAKYVKDPSQLNQSERKIFDTSLIEQIKSNPSWLDAFRKRRLGFYQKHCPDFYQRVEEYSHVQS